MRSPIEIREILEKDEEKPPCISYIIRNIDRSMGPISALILMYYMAKKGFEYKEARDFIKAYALRGYGIGMWEKNLFTKKEYEEIKEDKKQFMPCEAIALVGYCSYECSAFKVRARVALPSLV